MKKIAVLLMLVGVAFLAVGGYKFYKTQAAEKESLKEAHALLEKNDDKQKIDPTAFKPKTNETVGLLEIPSIDASLAIVEGTDPDDLEKGVGHYAGSAYPAQNDQVVLSGHRDTVFRRLGDVSIGDTFTIKLPHGDFDYEMIDSKIVDADDTSIIKSTAPNEELVITTCYPFSYVGNAPERYIIYAQPVK
ncbi:sortase D [Paraliobacillus ryukyuensis]|uniref:Sortase A n=1 Tax=Paraliobacillus ryukyuensis TaxID=200904 RepID=A0A366EE99_9BACI|nr:class D sortase [Paraliobacillus ryukyuensis]RBP00717.1 sortase A [Paraliobacillus ryukyuensis]